MSKIELFERDLQDKSGVFKALSHPARIKILEFLSQQTECFSGNISEHLPLSRTTVNQHLNELKSCGIVKGEISGRNISYCIDIKRLKEIRIMFTSLFDSLLFSTCNKCSD
jgi:DNA-binding transcriptional ArsR family regulator